MNAATDEDPRETQEWIESLEAVAARCGPQRAYYLINRLMDRTRLWGGGFPHGLSLPYVNTIPAVMQKPMPGDPAIEHRLRAMIRWNAAVMVLRANKRNPGIGGHIASFASAATLYDVGFNHFFRAPTDAHGGDLIFVQGHSSPGIYARAFLEGRLSEDELDNFRREAASPGLSSYPHPRLMPEFWEFPTVSMGLGPIMAIYQARFMKYLQDRKLLDGGDRKVWAFVGDGEMDEPESVGAISLAGREKLDNLIFVVNCNLQRLDGPVRGNGKIIQELERLFHGCGWNVIKVIWGGYWDPLLAKDKDKLLLQRMEEAVDGDYQNYKARDGAYTRKHFFGKYPELAKLVEDLSDRDIWRLNRGGHDPHKVYAAYDAAVNCRDQPTVILAKTVKGYGMGESGEGQNRSHQQKKMDVESLKRMRDRFKLPLSDEQVAELEYLRPDENSEEIRYMKQRRAALGGFLPQRARRATALKIPPLSEFTPLLKDSGAREFSTTMAFVRILTLLCRNPDVGERIVPIVPDEARTFGMEGLFRRLGIYSSVGQLYEPQDVDQVMFYKEDKSGQILEEAICEAGAVSSWIAAATAASTHGISMIPFYVFYSMFGFQRIGDLAWAAGDMQARGFLIGGTSGRTTLAGEGLQHQDGHSHVFASAYPSCVAYDPCFAYELAVIIHHGLKRMYAERDSVFFYVTTMNENYPHPQLPEGAEEGIIKGLYRLPQAPATADNRVRLVGSGAILREVIAAAALLEKDWGIGAEVWSATSFNQLHRDALETRRWNRLRPQREKRTAYVRRCFGDDDAPIVAASDYLAGHAGQIAGFLEQPYYALGTDGFGRSDTREALREFFEVDRNHVAATALYALAEQGKIPHARVAEAYSRYGVNPDKTPPFSI